MTPEEWVDGMKKKTQKPESANPKDILAVRKVPLGLLPGVTLIYGALAMKNGAAKYGQYNWRNKKVKMTVYLDAMDRHLISLRDGEDDAGDSKVPHLAHIIACAGILADAREGGFLIDDRPPAGPASAALDRYAEKAGLQLSTVCGQLKRRATERRGGK